MHTFLRECSRRGESAFGVWSTAVDPLLVEALAATAPDYVCIDMQHGMAHEGDLVSMFQAVVSGGSRPVVRVPGNNAAQIMRALDAGAQGVIVPLVESGEQAAAAVAACRYPPAGLRSYGPFRAGLHDRSTPCELEDVACIAMVETRGGMAQLSAIAATEGLTAIYIGPADLSLALGLPPGSHDAPEFVAALDTIRTACGQHGIGLGMHCHDGVRAAEYARRGFGMVTVAVDVPLLRRALATELDAARRGGGGGIR